MKPRDDSMPATLAAPTGGEIVLPPEYRVLPTSVPSRKITPPVSNTRRLPRQFGA